MTKHRSYGAAFKRQAAEEFIPGGRGLKPELCKRGRGMDAIGDY